MKKTLSILSCVTILSACGTNSSDVTNGRHSPALNSPQISNVPQPSMPVPQINNQVSGQAPYALGRSLVPPPPPVTMTSAPLPKYQIQPMQMAGINSLPITSNPGSTGRRLPEANRNAIGIGSADLLGPAPAPAVTRVPLGMPNNNSIPAIPVIAALPKGPTQKLQAVAASMPEGKMVPKAPPKGASYQFEVPAQTASAKPAIPMTSDIHTVAALPSVGADMPNGAVIPQAPNKDKQVQPIIAQSEIPQIVVDKPVAAPVPEVRNVAIPPLAAQELPKAAQLPAVPAKGEMSELPVPVTTKPQKPVLEIRQVAPLPSVAQNMPQGKIFPPVPPVVKVKPPEPELHQVPPLAAAAENLPKNFIFPSAPSPSVVVAPVAVPAVTVTSGNSAPLLTGNHVVVNAPVANSPVEANIPAVSAPVNNMVSPPENMPDQIPLAPVQERQLSEPPKLAVQSGSELPRPTAAAKAINTAPAPETVKIANNVADFHPRYDQYPNLANMPPQPPAPPPAGSDSRVVEMKRELQTMQNTSQDNQDKPAEAKQERPQTVESITPAPVEPVQVRPAAALEPVQPPVAAPAPPAPPLAQIPAPAQDTVVAVAPTPAPAPVEDPAQISPAPGDEVLLPNGRIRKYLPPKPLIPKGPTIVVKGGDDSTSSAYPNQTSIAAPQQVPTPEPTILPVPESAVAASKAASSGPGKPPGFLAAPSHVEKPVQQVIHDENTNSAPGDNNFENVQPDSEHTGYLPPSRYSNPDAN